MEFDAKTPSRQSTPNKIKLKKGSLNVLLTHKHQHAHKSIT